MEQKTLGKEITISGIGQHKGAENSLALCPAPANHGIVFKIRGREFPLLAENVFGQGGYTSIGERVKTIEHLVSALHGAGVDNLLVETESEECPILDGSALPYLEKLEAACLESQDMPRRAIKILRKVEFADDRANVSIEPADAGLSLDVEIDYPDIRPIGRQRMEIALTPENYRTRIAPARSFARLADVECLHSKGLAMGASMKTGIAVDANRVLNPEGLRFPDEFVAHKVMDAVGDLYMNGMTLVGLYRSAKGGHYHNNMLLRKLLADAGNYEIVPI